ETASRRALCRLRPLTVCTPLLIVACSWRGGKGSRSVPDFPPAWRRRKEGAMGAYLSQPNLAKDTQDGDDGELRWGAAGMQGWRTGMEDSHLACLDLIGKDSTTPAADPAKKIAAFAVFDGHGGAEVAKYCSAHICDVVKGTEAFKEGNLGLGLKQTFLKMDDMLRTPAGQAELLALKKASQGEDSDSDDGEDEVVDMDMLSKI
ncbi:unnamed protein product, partial [Ectocarpus sp. 12 AP-2014]